MSFLWRASFAQELPAIPELVKLMCDTNKPAISWRAMMCLTYIGDAAAPVLRSTPLLTDPDWRVRLRATNWIETWVPKALEKAEVERKLRREN